MAAIAEINRRVPGDANVTFSADAEAYALGFKKVAGYNLWWMPTDCTEWDNNTCTGTETSYGELETYINSHNSPVGEENEFGDWVGVDFQRDADSNATNYQDKPAVYANGDVITTLAAGQNGKLVIVDSASPSGDEELVGTWEVITLPYGAGIAIEMTPLEGFEDFFDEENLLAVTNGAVYVGEHSLGSTEFVADGDGLEFNAVATADIKAAIIAYANMAPVTGPIIATLAQGNGVWAEYKGSNFDELQACYEFNADGTFSVSEGGPTFSGTVLESGYVLTYQDATGAIVGATATVSPQYSDSLMSLDMVWDNDQDNREWRKQDSCSTGGTTPPENNAEYELDVEKLTLTTTTWTWQDLVLDVNGNYITDPDRDAEEDTIAVNADNTLTIGGSATLKYLGAITGSELNSSIFTSAVQIHKIAYIRDVEEIDSWGDIVRDYENNTFSTLENFIAYFNGADGKVYSSDNLPDGQGLAFGANGFIVIVDSSGLEVNSDAGRYEIITRTDDSGTYRVIKTLPTYAGYSDDWHNAFLEKNSLVERGDWSPVDGGGIFTLFSVEAREQFATWFSANADTLTDELWFEESKSALSWRDEFNDLVATPATTFINLSTLYSVGVDKKNDHQEENQEVSQTQIDFSALEGQTIYFENANGNFGLRTFNSDGTTSGLLSWEGAYKGTYMIQDNVIEVTNNSVTPATLTTLAFSQQPDFSNLEGVSVSLNGTSQSVWNTAYPLPDSFLNVKITYSNSNGISGERYFGEGGLSYDGSGTLTGGYIYNPFTGVLTIREAGKTLYITLPLDLVDLSALAVTVISDLNGAELFSGTTAWTVNTSVSEILPLVQNYGIMVLYFNTTNTAEETEVALNELEYIIEAKVFNIENTTNCASLGFTNLVAEDIDFKSYDSVDGKICNEYYLQESNPDAGQNNIVEFINR